MEGKALCRSYARHKTACLPYFTLSGRQSILSLICVPQTDYETSEVPIQILWPRNWSTLGYRIHFYSSNSLGGLDLNKFGFYGLQIPRLESSRRDQIDLDSQARLQLVGQIEEFGSHSTIELDHQIYIAVSRLFFTSEGTEKAQPRDRILAEQASFHFTQSTKQLLPRCHILKIRNPSLPNLLLSSATVSRLAKRPLASRPQGVTRVAHCTRRTLKICELT